MNQNQPEDLRPYRAYFGLTMLQFLGGLALLGIVITVVGRFLF
jgi:hypothetical protein